MNVVGSTVAVCFFLGVIAGELLTIAMTLGDIRRELRKKVER